MGLSFSVKLALNFKILSLQNRNLKKFLLLFFLVKKNSDSMLNFFMIFKLHFMYFYRVFFLSTLGPRTPLDGLFLVWGSDRYRGCAISKGCYEKFALHMDQFYKLF